MRSPSRRGPLLLSSFLVLFAPSLVACTSASAPPQLVQPPAAPEFTIGAHVRVNRGGQWLAATVMRVDGGDRYTVHYDGFGPEWSESVPGERMHPDAAAAAAVVRDYRVGERVIVSTQQRPMLADVIQQLGPEQWRVHYDGYGPEVAEDVGPERIHRAFTGVSAHLMGEPVGVEVNGQIMPGKIAAAIDATRWIVRFDGYGGQYDQALGAERLRALPPPSAPQPVIAPISATPMPAEAPGEKGKKGKHKDKEKEKDKPTAVAPEAPRVVPAGPPQVGDAILVSQRGAYVPATISAINGGNIKVKYEAGAAEEDLPADRVSRAAPTPKGVHFAPNQLVFVEWHGLFVLGKVLKEPNRGEYKIRFDGFGPEYDEVVVAKRLRARP